MKITPTSTIQVDESMYEVSKMSESVQQMIEYFDDWRQKEIDLTSELLMVRGALRDLQSTLSTTIKHEREEALKKATELGLVPPAIEAELNNNNTQEAAK